MCIRDRRSPGLIHNYDYSTVFRPCVRMILDLSSKISRDFLEMCIRDRPTGIINIVDATNIERNLYLTMQLMELDTPMGLALNMMDETRGNGGTVRINKMEAMLGIPVVPISAAKNEGCLLYTSYSH